MSIATSKKKKQMFTEINITPLTDIFLVLLIIMMVVAPTFQSLDNNIKVPEINSGLSVGERNATVSITADGEMFLNNEPIQNEEELVIKLSELQPTLDKKNVVVRADEQTKSSEIMKVMRAAQEAEFEKLTIAGEPLTGEQQAELQNGMTGIEEDPLNN